MSAASYKTAGWMDQSGVSDVANEISIATTMTPTATQRPVNRFSLYNAMK